MNIFAMHTQALLRRCDVFAELALYNLRCVVHLYVQIKAGLVTRFKIALVALPLLHTRVHNQNMFFKNFKDSRTKGTFATNKFHFEHTTALTNVAQSPSTRVSKCGSNTAHNKTAVAASVKLQQYNIHMTACKIHTWTGARFIHGQDRGPCIQAIPADRTV